MTAAGPSGPGPHHGWTRVGRPAAYYLIRPSEPTGEAHDGDPRRTDADPWSPAARRAKPTPKERPHVLYHATHEERQPICRALIWTTDRARSMRLLVFSDLHRDRDAARSLVERSGEADVLIGAGDFAVKRLGLDDVIEILREVDKPIVLVPGNGESDVELRDACAGWSSAHVLHGEGVTLEGVPFYGIGAGIPVTPFGEWSFDLTEDQADEMLTSCPENGVFVTHSPPYGHVDETGGQHLGSHAVLETIERVSPRLVVCGHIHGCWGKRSEVGSTVVLNAGPEGHVLDV